MNLYTHLNFGGNCEEAFRYYEKHLGGRVTMMMNQNQLPPGVPKPGDSDQFVIHARMDLGGIELIGNDVPKKYFQPIRSSYLYLAVDSDKDADRIYSALKDGGEVTMAMSEQFFASRFAQLRDRFGVLWTVIHEKPRPDSGQ